MNMNEAWPISQFQQEARMCNKAFTTLQVVFRYILSGLLLSSFILGEISVVHAQGNAPRTVTTLSTDLHDDDDCGGDDERGITATSGSDSDDCSPRVRASAVWTADENLQPKTSFSSGDSIQWVIRIKNRRTHAVSVKLTYDVKDPTGKVIHHSDMKVTASPGLSDWPVSGVVPDMPGTYSFVGSAKYKDVTTRKTIRYDVGDACSSLTVSSTPEAGGTVNVSPVPNCNDGYTSGTVVTLSAGANEGYIFANWSGDVTGSANPATLTMTADASVTANFVEFTGLTAGTHDDTDPAWGYTDTWSTSTNASYYNGTLHTSTTAGNSATVTIYGSSFVLYYTGGTDYGNLDVYVDNVKVSTINQSSATTQFQMTWTSPTFTNGIHNLEFVHVNGAGVNIDAIQVYTSQDSAAPGAITNLATASGTNSGTVDLTWTAPGDDNNSGTAASYLVRYSTTPITDEAAWNASTPVASGIPAPSPAGSAETMTVTGLAPGTAYFFSVRAQDEGANLGGLSNSPSAVANVAFTYDDVDPAWSYTGNWTAVPATGPYNGTDHYSNDLNASASITFTGTSFSLLYISYSNRGNIEVWVDGVKTDTINAYDPTLVWQSTFTKTGLPAGTHTVTFRHGGPSGTFIDIDAVRSLEPDLLVPGNVTDFTASQGTANGSIELSWTAPADDAGEDASGAVASYWVKYSTAPFTSWSDGTLVGAGMPIPTTPGTTQTMTVVGLQPGTQYYFAIRARDEHSNFSADHATASATTKPYTPIGAGTYDDADPAWNYTGNWAAVTTTGPYKDTDHYSNDMNATASVIFTGTSFTLFYIQYYNRGDIDVWIDGVKVDTINASSSEIKWQSTYTRTGLSNGTHNVVFRHAGPSGSFIDIDAIQIGAPAASDIYDDINPAWSYTGDWTAVTATGPYGGTDHYSNDPNASATLVFNGSGFRFTYLTYLNRGSLEIWVDGVKVDTLNASSADLLWQAEYTKTNLGLGSHTVTFQHGGPSGTFIDIDALQILP
jgi:hypothetical protein